VLNKVRRGRGWGEGRKLQFGDRKLQISNRGITGAQNFNFVKEIPPEWGFPAGPKLFFGRKISARLKFREGGGAQLPPCHNGTGRLQPMGDWHMVT